MALSPVPVVATASGEAADAPDGAIPVTAYGFGGAGGDVAWADVTGVPAALTAAQAAATPSIRALGTSATTALAGNTVIPAVATTAPAALGATAAVGTGTTAARADHVHIFPTAAQVGAAATNHTQAATTVTVAAGAGIVGANVQLVLADLAARVVALETAP